MLNDLKPKTGVTNMLRIMSTIIAFMLLGGCAVAQVTQNAASQVQAREGDGVVSAQVSPEHVICDKFMGFGAEWDSNDYGASGVTAADFETISKRVAWMRLPVARVMMQSKWCYQGHGRYDWDAPQMKALYRLLDHCQKLGTTVLLADWGIEPPRLKTLDVTRVEDPRYAEIIANYLDYLINTKGYTCIKYFIVVNEPNYEVRDWGRWKAGVQHVSAALHRKELDGKVALLGSDHSNADDWHRNAVDQLKNTLGGYDIHRYASPEEVSSGALFSYFRTNWQYALENDSGAREKAFVVGEAGLWTPGSSYNRNPLNLDPSYGVLMSDYAVQAANAGSWAVLAWMLDDNSHLGFNWGMWKSSGAGLATKPWFYPWALLSRYFRPGSSIVPSRVSSTDVRVLAAHGGATVSPEGSPWTFCLVNRGASPKKIRLQVKGGPRLKLDRYLYSSSSAKVDKDGFPVPLDTISGDLGAGIELSCAANSVLILTSDNDAGAVLK